MKSKLMVQQSLVGFDLKYYEIRKITITGLFGHLNHTLDLSDPINIIMGDNGGRTGDRSLSRIIIQH